MTMEQQQQEQQEEQEEQEDVLDGEIFEVRSDQL